MFVYKVGSTIPMSNYWIPVSPYCPVYFLNVSDVMSEFLCPDIMVCVSFKRAALISSGFVKFLGPWGVGMMRLVSLFRSWNAIPFRIRRKITCMFSIRFNCLTITATFVLHCDTKNSARSSMNLSHRSLDRFCS